MKIQKIYKISPNFGACPAVPSKNNMVNIGIVIDIIAKTFLTSNISITQKYKKNIKYFEFFGKIPNTKDYKTLAKKFLQIHKLVKEKIKDEEFQYTIDFGYALHSIHN